MNELTELLAEVEYILSIDYDSQNRNLELSKDTVDTLREKYRNLTEVWETIKTVLTSQT